jgi:beta-phosphoglucomutase
MIMKNVWREVKAVIFDMDGVLIDSYNIHMRALNTISNERGFKVSDDEFKRLFGLTSEEGIRLLEKMKGFSKGQLDDFVCISDEKFRDFFTEEVKIINGSLDFVRILKNKNILTGIGTSAPHENVDVFLDSLNVRELFDVIVSGDDVSKGKPDPEIYLKASKILCIEPKNCMVFEDSLMGITSAKGAGMYCTALTTTHKADELKIADFIINDFENLWEIVEG